MQLYILFSKFYHLLHNIKKTFVFLIYKRRIFSCATKKNRSTEKGLVIKGNLTSYEPFEV